MGIKAKALQYQVNKQVVLNVPIQRSTIHLREHIFMNPPVWIDLKEIAPSGKKKNAQLVL